MSAFVLACGDDSSEAVRIDPPVPETVELSAVIEPAPTPPPGRAQAVALLSAGLDATQPLRTAARIGEERVLVISLDLQGGGRKPTLSPPEVRLRFASALERVDTDGSKRRTFELAGIDVHPRDDDSDAGAVAEGMRALVQPITTLTGDAFEAIALEQPNVVPPPLAATDSLFSALDLALDHLTVPLPTEPVASGAKWIVTRELPFFGVPGWQTLECTLQKWEGDQIEIRADVSWELAEAGRHTLPITLGGISTGRVTATLTARLDRATAVPIEARLRGTAKIEGADPAVAGKPRTLTFDLRIDEDYMAQNDPRVAWTGQFKQGGLVHGVVAPGTTVWFDKRRVRLSDEGDFLLGFGRSAGPRALVSFEFEGSPTERHVVHVEARTYETETIDGLPEDMVDLDSETRKGLAASRVRIDRVRNHVTNVAYFRDGWRWPVQGRITSTYGRKRVLNGADKGFHWGVDIAAPAGRKVVAPASGVVVFADEEVPLSGTLLIIDHGYGLTSSFLHLKEILVKVGDEVKAGQVVARLGSTGRSTGPHLDWRMNLFDTRVDPETLLPPM